MSNRVVTPIVLLALLLVGYYFSTLIESYEEEIDIGWSVEAQKNPYLAAHYYLEALDYSVDSQSNLLDTDSLASVDTVLLDDASHAASFKKTNELLEWMRQGGHLIAGVSGDVDADNALLNNFAISLYESEYESEYDSEDTSSEDDEKRISEVMEEYNRELEEKQQAEHNKNDKASGRQKPSADDEHSDDKQHAKKETVTELTFNGVDGAIAIEFSPYNGLYQPYIYDEANNSDSVFPEPFYWGGSDQGIHIVQFTVGEGMLTLLSDTSIWHSENIGDYDHALLLNVLASQNGHTLILYGAQMRSLLVLLIQNATELVTAFLLLVALSLWRGAQRVGPVYTPTVTVRRSIAEHIQAMANYYWFEKSSTALLESLRAEVKKLVSVRCPDYARLLPQEQVAWLASRYAFDAEQLYRAMFADAIHREDDVLQVTQCLYRIKKAMLAS